MSAPARLATGVGGAVGVALLAAACSSGAAAAPGGVGQHAGQRVGPEQRPGQRRRERVGLPRSSRPPSSSAGTFLTDGSGRAVYLWAKDTGGMSACTGACAGAWPPVTASAR